MDNKAWAQGVAKKIQEKEIDQTWKRMLRPTLEMFVKRSPRSFIEEK